MANLLLLAEQAHPSIHSVVANPFVIPTHLAFRYVPIFNDQDWDLIRGSGNFNPQDPPTKDEFDGIPDLEGDIPDLVDDTELGNNIVPQHSNTGNPQDCSEIEETLVEFIGWYWVDNRATAIFRNFPE